METGIRDDQTRARGEVQILDGRFKTRWQIRADASNANRDSVGEGGISLLGGTAAFGGDRAAPAANNGSYEGVCTCRLLLYILPASVDGHKSNDS